MTLGQSCIMDNTTYFDFGPDGGRPSNVVIRDNCQSPRFYCDPEKNVCVLTKAVGFPCLSDVECQTVRPSLPDISFKKIISEFQCAGYVARMWSRREVCGATGDALSHRTMAVGYYDFQHSWRYVMIYVTRTLFFLTISSLSSPVCVIAMMATCLTLFLVHKRHRYQRHKDLREYYLEQLRL